MISNTVTFQNVSSEDRRRLQKILNFYESAFPSDERRSTEQFYALLQNPLVDLLMILSNGDEIGYLICWNLPQFLFIEHFEIFPAFRNQSYGSATLIEVSKKHSKIILESEPETESQTAEKRIKFYQRNGFNILDTNYFQPPYQPEKNAVSMYLLCNFFAENLEEIRRQIHQTVYAG